MNSSVQKNERLPILYSFRRCPYAIRARMAIATSEVRVSLREVVLRNKPQELLEASPKGTVPVLVLPDGKVIEGSLEVMQWALSLNDPEGWLMPDDEERRQEAEQLIAENDSSFKRNLDGYKYPDRQPGQTAEAHRQQAEMFLTRLNDRLNDRLRETNHLLGPKASLADIAIFPFVRQFARVDPDWFDGTSYEPLRNWLDRFSESNLFKRVMIKGDPWTPGNSVLEFPPPG